MANFKKLSDFVVKVCKSGAFAVIFFLFCAMQLFGTTFVLFIAKYPVFAIANIVTMVLLIALYLCARFRE